MVKILFSYISILIISANNSLAQITYQNPRVYNVEYTFELCPEKEGIDPLKDLKLWIPVPRDWDSQKAVKIISVEPEPQNKYVDPEFGNQIYFWNFGKEPEQTVYTIKINYRTEVYEVYCKINPDKVESFDPENKNYKLYTRSTHTININQEIKEIARSIIGNEKNPYVKAKLLFNYVVKHMEYQVVRRERGSSVESILNYATRDPKTGEKFFEGQCDHYSILFVALCRAVGIPARGVTGFIGWAPWITKNDLKLRDKRHTLLTSEGLAATRLFGPFGGHIWAEFYLPGYGWIPADPTWNQFASQRNIKLTITKGRDIKMGPNVTTEDDGLYGDQWIPLHNGKINTLGWGVWNIAKIHVANAKVIHYSDPFPADAFAESSIYLLPVTKSEDNLKIWRKDQTRIFYKKSKTISDSINIFKNELRLKTYREAYLCHLLRYITGERKFRKIFEIYLDLRSKKGESIPINEFKKIAEEIYGNSLDFFFNEWLKSNTLPRLKLTNPVVQKKGPGWIVKGELLQEGKVFHFPVEVVVKTNTGNEAKKIWIENAQTDFQVTTSKKPVKLVVDPDFHIPTIRWMPPKLEMIWDAYPDLTVIYGTLKDAQENKKAAERFVNEFAGLNHKIMKPDTAISKEDMKAKCLILIGRPETNKIASCFKNYFPIKFTGNQFLWNDTMYNKPLQGVAQIIENPQEYRSLIILYAGLTGNATMNIFDKNEWRKELNGNFLIDLHVSYVIFDGIKIVTSGDWKYTNSDMVWNF